MTIFPQVENSRKVRKMMQNIGFMEIMSSDYSDISLQKRSVYAKL